MRFRFVAFFAAVGSTFASAESEHEPSRSQATIIAQASEAFQKSQISEITSHFNPNEQTSYYLKDISFLGRHQTESGYKLAFRCLFIRSSSYRDDALTPPRGHSFLVVLTDDFGYLRHFSIENDTKLSIKEGLVYADGLLLCNLRKLIPSPSKTEQGAAANP